MKVVFCYKYEFINLNENDVIYICPIKRNLNDLRYKTRANFLINMEGSVYEGEILVSILSGNNKEGRDFDGIGNIFSKESKEYSFDSEEIVFFSLLPSMGDYRSLVNRFGKKKSIEILDSINDLVYLKNYGKSNQWYKRILKSTIFFKSFIRNSESFFAFHNAKDIIEGEFERFDYISSKINLSFKIDQFDNAHEINFYFDSSGLIPKRINVLIGENGLGKSQALNYFVRAALQQKNFLDCLVDPTSKIKRPMISRVLAIGTPGETKYTYPSDSIKNPKLHYRRLFLTKNSRSKLANSLGENIVRLARSQENIGTLNRWEIFIDALQKCLPLDQIVIPIIDNLKIPIKSFRDHWDTEETLDNWFKVEDSVEPKIEYNNKYYPLSSGQLSFFKFALLACLHIENGSFVLLDEPETHLHPSLISNFVALLDSMLERTGSYSIIATHSPYFVREVAREQVHVFKREGSRNISIISPRLKTFGANIGDISDFVFNDEMKGMLVSKVVLNAKKENYSFEMIKENYSSNLSVEMLHTLKYELER